MIIPHSDSGDGHELLAGTAPTLMLPLLGTRAVEGVITADVGRRWGEGTFHCTSSRASLCSGPQTLALPHLCLQLGPHTSVLNTLSATAVQAQDVPKHPPAASPFSLPLPPSPQPAATSCTSADYTSTSLLPQAQLFWQFNAKK